VFNRAMARRSISILWLLAACSNPPPDARPHEPGSAPHSAAAPPIEEAPRDARLAVLRADAVSVLDAADLDAPAQVSVRSDGARVILDATAEPRFLLGDAPNAPEGRVILTHEEAAHVVASEADGAFFSRDGRAVVERHRYRFSCGGRMREPSIEIFDRSGALARQDLGQVLGYGDDRRSLLLRRPTEGPCSPMGGRELAAPSYTWVDLEALTRLRAPDRAIQIGLWAANRRIGSIDHEDSFGFGRSCALVVAGERYRLSGSSCDRDG
jgi:hypothetical protein